MLLWCVIAIAVKCQPSNVLLTVAQKMGVEAAKFADATGTLTGLA